MQLLAGHSWRSVQSALRVSRCVSKSSWGRCSCVGLLPVVAVGFRMIGTVAMPVLYFRWRSVSERWQGRGAVCVGLVAKGEVCFEL